MTQTSRKYISEVRKASRDLVRELGFMGRTIAGTNLSASAVHAIIEIGTGALPTAKVIADSLRLEKSTVSRLIKSLVARQLVSEVRSEADSRIKFLYLTKKGGWVLKEITQFGEDQVAGAINSLNFKSRETILAGLRSYAQALKSTRTHCNQDLADRQQGPKQMQMNLQINTGYIPGIIGRIASMHAQYYSRETGFGEIFESKVAGGMAEFIPRLDQASNQIWSAGDKGQVLAAIAIDGECIGNNIGQLRWFIVDDELRGMGIGRRLISKAVKFCDQLGFDETHLWTLKGLDAARKLYEDHGFVLAREYYGEQWGPRVLEQKYIRVIA